MRLKKNLILLILLIVFAAIVLIVERPFETKSIKKQAGSGLLFPGLQAESIRELRIKKSTDETTVIKKRDNRWALFYGGEEYPADQRLVDEAIEQLQQIQAANLASRKKDKHELFEVTEGKATEVILLDDREKELAHLFVGKSGPDFFSTYIRKADSDQVYLEERFPQGLYDQPTREWRDKTLLEFDPKAVTSVNIEKKEEAIRLSKDTQGNWHLEEPVSSLGESQEVERLLKGFATLQASDFADNISPEESGLKEPAIRITVTLKDSSTRGLSVGAQKDKEPFYYVKRADRKYIYTLPQQIVEALTPAVKDLQKSETTPEEAPPPVSPSQR